MVSMARRVSPAREDAEEDEQEAQMSPAAEGSDAGVSVASLEQAHLRLEHLYEIGKLYATFETVAQTFDRALGLVARTLPLCSAILIETEEGRSKMTVWPSGGEDAKHLRVAVELKGSEERYAYLVGASSADSLDLSERDEMNLRAGSRSAFTC